MKPIIQNRVEALRQALRRKGMAAFIIPATDPHMSEYVAPHWKAREWISGFTGSAGTVVVTLDKAGLWTDSRYFLQGAAQLEGTGIDLYKEGLPETASINEFLAGNLSAGSVVGIDGGVFAVNEAEKLKSDLAKHGIGLETGFDPMDEIWEDRPPVPQNPAFIYDVKYAGRTCAEKIEDIRRELEKYGCESTLLSALDEIAWTLNLRGNDVKCNPVLVSYLLITRKEAVFFILPEKITPEVKAYLQSQQIAIRDYNEVGSVLSVIAAASILLPPAKTNIRLFGCVNPSCAIVRDNSPVALLKAIRNKTEVKGLHEAMRKDGVALVKFMKWLKEAVPQGTETELSVTEKLRGFRAGQESFIGESFDTIAGYGEHGAIIHYSATPESNVRILPKGFLLLDSGAQYLDGTTDITRTIALGELTEEEKTDYTLVLKGHIALAMAKFPAGTRGSQLDVLARIALWKRGMNYLHGTGHGVGHFMNVHEGPQNIRMNENPATLHPGMVTSNEPGVYRAGKHGIRTENLTLVVKEKEGMFGDYYAFETVTLCPICTKGIVKELLSREETEWLNSYHRNVYGKLSPYLQPDEKSLLEEMTREI